MLVQWLILPSLTVTCSRRQLSHYVYFPIPYNHYRNVKNDTKGRLLCDFGGINPSSKWYIFLLVAAPYCQNSNRCKTFLTLSYTKLKKTMMCSVHKHTCKIQKTAVKFSNKLWETIANSQERWMEFKAQIQESLYKRLLVIFHPMKIKTLQD